MDNIQEKQDDLISDDAIECEVSEIQGDDAGDFVESEICKQESEIDEFDKNENLLVSVNFDIKIDEEDRAFLLFQRKYIFRKNWIKTVAFGLLSVGFIVSIIKNPNTPMNFMLLAICIAAIFVIWYNTKAVRKSLMNALKILEDDRYIFYLYDDKFMIETIIPEEEKKAEEFVPIPPKIVEFADKTLSVIEREDMFVLILRKETIFVLPKRCMNNLEISQISEVFEKKLGEEFSK